MGGAMDVIIGIIVYVVILAGFMSFGKFLKDCDETLFEQLKADHLSKKPAK
jgi:hypothetical protein